MYVTPHKQRQGMERIMSTFAAQSICLSTFIRTFTNLSICTVFVEKDAKMSVNVIIRCIQFTFTFIFFLNNKAHSKEFPFNIRTEMYKVHTLHTKNYLRINFSCCFKSLFNFSFFLLVFPVIYVCIQKVISVC